MDFMISHGGPGDLRAMVEDNHASVVPESEEKHSDTTQQNIQMLKEELERPSRVNLHMPMEHRPATVPSNLEIQNVKKLDDEHPFSIRATDISAINKEDIRTILTTKDNHTPVSCTIDLMTTN